MKNTLRSNACIWTVAALLVTACGNSVENGQAPKAPPVQKPIDIASDQASVVLQILTLSEYEYLESALQLIFSNKSQVPCQTISGRQGYPAKAGQMAPLARMILTSRCRPTDPNGVDLNGEEEAQVENLILDDKSLPTNFSRFTIQSFEPLAIRGYGLLSGQNLKALKSLTLTRTQTLPGVIQYHFELLSNVRTSTRQNFRGGKWKIQISGMVNWNTNSNSWTLGQLINHIDSQVLLKKTGSKTEIETSSLNAAVSGSPIDSCGRPTSQWEDIYSTSLFPEQNISLNYQVKDQKIQNLTLSKDYEIEVCLPSRPVWAADIARAHNYLRQMRDL